MSATLTDGTNVITPTLWLGYEAESESRNVVHQLLGGGIDVSLQDDDPRTGTLELFFEQEADAWQARDWLAAAAVWTFSDPDVTPVGMTFVRSGRMRIRLEEETRTHWIVPVGFQEVIL